MANASITPKDQKPLALPQISIMVTMLNGEEKHGYEIMKQIEANGDRLNVLGATTLYRNIKLLLKRELLKEVPPPANANKEDERRKYYQITGLGRRVINAELDRLQGLVNAARDTTTEMGVSLALQGGG